MDPNPIFLDTNPDICPNFYTDPVLNPSLLTTLTLYQFGKKFQKTGNNMLKTVLNKSFYYKTITVPTLQKMAHKVLNKRRRIFNFVLFRIHKLSSLLWSCSEQTVLASSVPTAAPSSTDINTTATVNSAAVPPPPPSEGASAQELILDFLPERPSPVDPTVMLGRPGTSSWSSFSQYRNQTVFRIRLQGSSGSGSRVLDLKC